MHHHVALDSDRDIERLWRFLRGEALGYVASGGGAYCAAHIGVYKAFRDTGTSFDIVGGTSGGAAMAAAFAQDVAPEEIDARVHRMFIEGSALARYTLPRYSLLDHTHFDRHLINEYGTSRIEDLWKPYFAVSADLSAGDIEVHRSGLVWQAIRASAAIPGLLPPFFNSAGRMLVDGSIIANVPIEIDAHFENRTQRRRLLQPARRRTRTTSIMKVCQRGAICSGAPSIRSAGYASQSPLGRNRSGAQPDGQSRPL